MAIARSLFEGDAPVGYQPMKDKSPEELIRHFSESQVVALIAYVQKVGTYHEIGKEGPPSGVPLDPDSYRNLTGRSLDFHGGKTTSTTDNP